MPKPQRVNKPMTGHFKKNDITPKKTSGRVQDWKKEKTFEVGQQNYSCGILKQERSWT